MRYPDMQLYTNAKVRARKKNIEFNITRNDIVIPDICPILNIPLFYSTTGKACSNSPTLDRVDINKGYIKGNVRVISHRANSMKQDNTIETLEKLIQYIKKEI